MDRRTFCLGSAAAAFCWRPRGAFAARVGTNIALDQVLYDSRFILCRSFAAAARRSGRRTLAFNGDVTRVWQDTLRPRWSAGCGPIGGITTRPGLFCLEQLAGDHWRRVLVRNEMPGEPGLVSWVIS